MKKLFYCLMITTLSLVGYTQTPNPPEPIDAPVAPEAPPSPEMSKKNKMNGDTMKIKVGDKQILIIEREGKTEKSSDEETENAMSNDEDESKMHHENISPVKKKSKQKAADVDFLDIDYGVNILLKNDAPASQADDLEINVGGSRSLTLNFFPTEIYLGTKHLRLMTGLGWHFGSYEFKKALNFTPNKTLEYTTADNRIKESELRVQHLQVPLMLYANTKRIKGLGNIGLGVGGYAGVLIKEKLRLIKQEPNEKVKIKENYGFNNFRYGLSTRLDIGAIKLFANYDMSELWKDNDYSGIECGIWFDL